MYFLLQSYLIKYGYICIMLTERSNDIMATFDYRAIWCNMATCPPTTSDRGRFDPRTPLNRLSDSSRDLPDSLLQVKYGIFAGSVRGLLLNRLPLIIDRVYQSLSLRTKGT